MFKKYIFLILFLFIIFCNQNNNFDNNTLDENLSTTTTELVFPVEFETNTTFEPPYKHHFVQLENCDDFLGSKHNLNCVLGIEVLESIKFETSVTNIVEFDNIYYITLKNGLIYTLNLNNIQTELFLDYRENVKNQFTEDGLLDIEFNKVENNFIISYVNIDNELVFELFEYFKSPKNIENSKILLKIKNESNQHYAGSISWSNLFNTYLVGIGDMSDSGPSDRLNSDPQNTSSFKGKLMILDNENEFNLNSIRLNIDNSESIENLIAIGLRNPWQFFEFKDYLIIFDTGFTQNEELNIVKFQENIFNFGWPVFEATKRSMDLDNLNPYTLEPEIFFWDESTKLDAIDYIQDTAILPDFYYNHFSCLSTENFNCDGENTIYRAAIIGGDIFENLNSKYYGEIIFADYFSEEIFTLNFFTREVSIFPIPNLNGINSVKIYEENKNTIFLTTTNGYLHILKLP